MRIATWNVNSITARLPRLLAWLESSGTDVLCLQEAKVAEEKFPVEEVRELGYESAVNATGRPMAPLSSTCRAVWIPAPRKVSGAHPTRRLARAAAARIAFPSVRSIPSGFGRSSQSTSTA